MTSVSITDFRDNLATYLRLVKYKGEILRVVDEKMGEPMVKVSPLKEKEGWDEYMRFVKSMFGVFKDLPEDKNRTRMKKAGIRKLKKLKWI